MKKVMTICTIATMILTVSGLTQAALLNDEGFETDKGDWTDLPGIVTRVASGTNGIASAGGGFHAEITPPSGTYDVGAYTFHGGALTATGPSWSSSIDIYIDLADPLISTDAYGFTVSQQMRDTINHDDNIFSVSTEAGSVYVESDGYGTAPARGEFTESGWYTFAWDFAVSNVRTELVHDTFSVLDALDNLVYSRDYPDEDVPVAAALGSGYMWFNTSNVTSLAIDNVQLNGVPEPATMAILGLGALFLRKRK